MTEHQKLAQACERLLAAIDAKYYGYMPDAIDRLAVAFEDKCACWPLENMRLVMQPGEVK